MSLTQHFQTAHARNEWIRANDAHIIWELAPDLGRFAVRYRVLPRF